MNCDHSTIVQHLHSMGKVQKSGVWVPHVPSQNHKNQRVAICASLLVRHRLASEQHLPFLSCIVTGDEKLCLYANIRKRKEWLSPNQKATPRTKTCAHPQKIMLAFHFLASTAPLTIIEKYLFLLYFHKLHFIPPDGTSVNFSLHIEVLSLENGVPSGNIGIFQTYSLVQAQPFLLFPYVRTKTQFLVIKR